MKRNRFEWTPAYHELLNDYIDQIGVVETAGIREEVLPPVKMPVAPEKVLGKRMGYVQCTDSGMCWLRVYQNHSADGDGWQLIYKRAYESRTVAYIFLNYYVHETNRKNVAEPHDDPIAQRPN